MPRVSWVGILAIVVAGCEPVLNLEPVITAADAIHDERVLGEWAVEDEDDRLVVTAQDGNLYRIDYNDENTGAAKYLMARIGTVGGILMAEIRPGLSDFDGNWPVARFLVRLRFVGDSMLLAILPQDAIVKLALEQAAPRHMWDDALILTGAGSQVRLLVEEFIRSGGEFVEEQTYYRVAP